MAVRAQCLAEPVPCLLEVARPICRHPLGERADRVIHVRKAYFRIMIESFEDSDGFIFSFHAHQVDFAQFHRLRQVIDGEFADQYRHAILFCRAFKPGSEIHTVANRGIFQPLGRSDIAKRGLALHRRGAGGE